MTFILPTGTPASVTELDGKVLRIDVTGKALCQPAAPEEQLFTDFLYSWGGTYMWKGLVMSADTKWLTNMVTKNTLVCVTDGSYSQGKAPNICGAGSVIYCTATKCYISVTLVEQSDSASAY